jgi:hypothetical protein
LPQPPKSWDFRMYHQAGQWTFLMCIFLRTYTSVFIGKKREWAIDHVEYSHRFVIAIDKLLFSFLVVLGFEFKVSSLLGRHSITWAFQQPSQIVKSCTNLSASHRVYNGSFFSHFFSIWIYTFRSTEC